jgi:translation initiation factor IF-3
MINVKEKEITIKPKIGENDLIRFINNTIDWLKSGYHVKLKIDAKDDISKLSSSEIKKLPRNLDKDEFKKRKNIIFKNNEAQIDILVKNIYDKFVTKLGNIARILQPLKKLTPVLYSAFFSFDKK